ncbi:hypothetical protein TSACC_3102 [Terrimicrobium sacchariphilum]|uniref:Uncharacterized protein n=1 Tax=Terrimicrobium sacchariphilum TaxID=690879 RepID=A0A146GD15_TERSA|nr:hypothetical protein TSACC_3102 [Terrimicrobium sacchariphilum]
MNIFSNLLRQVNQLSSIQLFLEGKRVDSDLRGKGFETGDATKLDLDFQPPGGKKPAIGQADIERVTDGRQRFGIRLLEAEERCVLLPLDQQSTALGDLVQMDFHSLEYFSLSRRTTLGGTKGRTSPPSLATSLTMRELR